MQRGSKHTPESLEKIRRSVRESVVSSGPLTSQIFSRYGHKWEGSTTDATIELSCYREMRLSPSFVTGHTPGFHFEKAIDLLWPEKTSDGRTCYIKSTWSERRIQSWCSWEFQTWWGASAVGKTMDAAIIIMTHCLSAPDRTAISVCSTDRKMLLRRLFGELVRLFYIQGEEVMPLNYSRSDIAFKYRIPGQQLSSSTNCGIFGVPIVPGKVDKAVGRIIGAHNDFSCLVCDELQASYSQVVEQGWDNLSSGCIEAKFLGMGNPSHKLDPLCKASKPINGWDSISPNLESWKTEKGICQYFDGLKSPGIADPDRFPFYLNKKQIDEMKKDPGENSARFWSMRRGFVPPEGLIQTVFSVSLIAQHNLQRKEVEWEREPTWLAALDESFSAGGDRCMFINAQIGMMAEGLMVIRFLPEIPINMELNDKEALEYFVTRTVKKHCEALGIPPSNFGLDITGSQLAMASIVEREWGPNIFRCQFGGSATNAEISRDDKSGKVVTAQDTYANRVTELWYNVKRFAINGQIAGMSDEACIEACQRIILPKSGRIQVESKKEMRKRTGHSPDIMDGYCIIVAMAMERFGMRPGTNDFGGEQDPIATETAMLYNPMREDAMYVADQIPGENEGGEEYAVDNDTVL